MAASDDDAYLRAFRRAVELQVTLAHSTARLYALKEAKRDAIRLRDAADKAVGPQTGAVTTRIVVATGPDAWHRARPADARRSALTTLAALEREADQLEAAVESFATEYARLPAWAKQGVDAVAIARNVRPSIGGGL
jgi:hypothetical protein